MIQERSVWWKRPAVIAGGAFVAGAIIAGAVVAVVLMANDDDDDGGNGNFVTPNGSATPATEELTPGSIAPEITVTPGDPRDPDDALANYVQQELNQRYIGPCPNTPPEQIENTMCSIELYRSDELVAFAVGPPASEVTGEVVLTPAENGVWTVDFIPATGQPPAVGGRAVVFGAGDCLTFRAGPGITQEPLSCQVDGNGGDVVGGPEVVDDITWWQIRDLGWASGEFLQQAP